MSDAPTSADLPRRSAPRKDRPVRPTPQITALLAIVSILANYGRHLITTLETRAVGRGFATIARFFGTAAFETIRAHLYRGVMRAVALEIMLQQRAKRGRDLKALAPRANRDWPAENATETGEATEAGQAEDFEHTEGLSPPEELTQEQIEAAELANEIKAGERLARRIARDTPLTVDALPRMVVFVAEVQRTPIGRTIAAICVDLGLSASLCEGRFWTAVCDAVEWYRGSLGTLVIEIHRRELKFRREEWKHPELDLPEGTREGIRRVLGFFVGEEPANPLEVMEAPGMGVAAVATGPP